MVAEEKGNISIHTENIFPIIKKFLYSDHEIFLRELVSNAVDASQKLKRLAVLGEYNGEMGDLKVSIFADKEAKTLTISDMGIGMTADEIKKYINQIAFSGATEFIETYKEKGGEGNEKIIGHFGMGFYSAFMVSKMVEIRTLSYKDGSEAARWTCDGSTEFEISSIEKAERGTDIILHLDDESLDFLEDFKLREILNKYCRFLPIPVFLGESEITDTAPLWTKRPSSLEDKDYLEFYQKLYPGTEEPLFWIHLNVDSPFQLTGILYFPRIKPEMDVNRHKIQLYSRQVFITDELKGIVPEFLTLLHGVIDSPDIPLNVSRSYLQADKQVKALGSHITRKVANKLADLFKENREEFEKKWEALGLFVKYGIITDDSFSKQAGAFLLLPNVDGKFFTLPEYREHIQMAQTDKDKKLVALYSTDVEGQNLFISHAKKAGYDVLLFDGHPIDNHFIQKLETFEEPQLFLKRVDSDSIEQLIPHEVSAESLLNEEQTATLKERLVAELGLDEKNLKLEALHTETFPLQLSQDEFMRRFSEMYAGSGNGMFGAMPDNLIVNTNHSSIAKIIASDKTVAKGMIRQLYNLALLAKGKLKGEALTQFIEASVATIA
jgi:molecular chaperone HtpG